MKAILKANGATKRFVIRVELHGVKDSDKYVELEKRLAKLQIYDYILIKNPPVESTTYKFAKAEYYLKSDIYTAEKVSELVNDIAKKIAPSFSVCVTEAATIVLTGLKEKDE